MSTAPLVLPCKCGRMATLYEGKLDEVNHLLQIICACGIKGAALTYQKPDDRARTMWAACDGWRIGSGGGAVQ